MAVTGERQHIAVEVRAEELDQWLEGGALIEGFSACDRDAVRLR